MISVCEGARVCQHRGRHERPRIGLEGSRRVERGVRATAPAATRSELGCALCSLRLRNKPTSAPSAKCTPSAAVTECAGPYSDGLCGPPRGEDNNDQTAHRQGGLLRVQRRPLLPCICFIIYSAEAGVNIRSHRGRTEDLSSPRELRAPEPISPHQDLYRPQTSTLPCGGDTIHIQWACQRGPPASPRLWRK
jgi:hypothetical protein